MKLFLRVFIIVVLSSMGKAGVPLYNNFGLQAPRIFNDQLRPQNHGFDISSPGPRKFVVNKGYFNVPPKPAFIDLKYHPSYNSGQQYHPGISLKTLPTENTLSGAQFVNLIYQPNQFQAPNAGPNTIASTFIPHIAPKSPKRVKIVQNNLGNVFEDTNLYGADNKDILLKEATGDIFRTVRANIDVVDAGSNNIVLNGEGILYQLLPNHQSPGGFEGLLSRGAQGEGRSRDLQIIKDFIGNPAFAENIGGKSQFQLVDEGLSLNTGEVLFQNIEEVPRNEIVKLFA